MMNYYRVLDKSKIHIDFASTNEIESSLLSEISAYGSKYFQLPRRGNVLKYWNAVRLLSKNYNIIHVHANSSTALIELSAAIAAGVPKRIHHNHNSKTQHQIINALLHPFSSILIQMLSLVLNWQAIGFSGKENMLFYEML